MQVIQLFGVLKNDTGFFKWQKRKGLKEFNGRNTETALGLDSINNRQ